MTLQTSSSVATLEMTDAEKRAVYADARKVLRALLEGERDWIAAMATAANVLFDRFDYFQWTGFYRAVSDRMLVVGPYQGGHGCLRIAFDRGVCGAAARTRQTQVVPDVDDFPGYIACSGSTRSEIVVPIITPDDRLLGVLDVDSDTEDAFGDVDRRELEAICRDLAEQFQSTSVL
ncbi:MAG TPA: GAF domain-containing protein [Rhodothermales bacterium]